MRNLFLTLMLATALIFPSLASAQSPVAIESIDVDLWPEYDKAEMLVINYIMLTAETTLPATVNLRIPAGVDAPHVVATGMSFDKVTDKGVQFTTKTEGAWLVVSIKATGPAIQFEYYDPALKKNGASRSYAFKWSSDYDVRQLVVVAQQPFGATNLKASVALQDDGIHPDKLQYYASQAVSINAGKLFEFDLNYEKPTDAFSVAQLQVTPVIVNENTPGRISWTNYLPYGIGGLGVIIIAVGIVYYLRSGVRVSAKKPRRRQSANADEEGDSDVYCAQCGMRARGGDRFCRTCGSRIKQQEE